MLATTPIPAITMPHPHASTHRQPVVRVRRWAVGAPDKRMASADGHRRGRRQRRRGSGGGSDCWVSGTWDMAAANATGGDGLRQAGGTTEAPKGRAE